jgi:hypothetical protein
MACEHLLDGISEILQQMPAVSDLLSLGSTSADGIAIAGGSVSCHNLDTGMELEPLDNGLCLTARQQINYAAAPKLRIVL